MLGCRTLIILTVTYVLMRKLVPHFVSSWHAYDYYYNTITEGFYKQAHIQILKGRF